MANYHKSFCVGKIVLVILIVVAFFNFVLAEDSWDSFDGGNDSSEVFVEDSNDDLIELGVEENESFENFNLEDSSFGVEDSFEYTPYFYFALGVGAIGILIAILFIYFFFRRPKNKWKK